MVTGSGRPDVAGPDYLAPLFGLFDDQLAEVGWRAAKRRGAQISEAGLQLGIGEAGIDRFIELLDDLGGRAPGRAYAVPAAGLVARHEFAHGRQVWKRLRACRCGHAQSAKLAGPDVLDRSRQRLEQDLHLSAKQI